MNKLLKIGLVAAVVLEMVGCASVEGVTNKMVNNKTEGVIYGTGAIATGGDSFTVCKAIKNADKRCAEPEKYKVVVVYSKFGYYDGAVGINTLTPIDFKNLNVLNHNFGTADKKVPFVKAKVTPGQLGELLEIVSTDGDGKCHWSGMPRAGGVVCDGLYDYRKDYTGVVFR